MDLPEFAAEVDRYAGILTRLEAQPQSEKRDRRMMTLGNRVLSLIHDMSKIAWSHRGKLDMQEVRDRAYAVCDRLKAAGFPQIGDPQDYYTRTASGELRRAGRYG